MPGALPLPHSWLTGGDRPDAPALAAEVQENLDALAIAAGSLAGRFFTGTGSPEGAVEASVGAIYTRRDGGAGSTLYVKESGSGNTGWSAK